MEPRTNPRVTKSLRRTFYNFSRRYGEQIKINKVDESSTDYETGGRTRTYESVTIRRAVPVPASLTREVSFTPSMMQAIREYAWQGGAGQDIETFSFLVADRDLRTWGEVDSTQFVEWRDNSYEVIRSWSYDGGFVIECKAARGSR